MWQSIPQMWRMAIVLWAAVSLIAVIVTAADKAASKRGRRRVPEATLLWIAALGGGIAMWITMRIIRHKTRKPKFMVGIPAIVIAEVAAVILIRRFFLS